jgi:hypothetical protein
LWFKGEESGHTQFIKAIYMDCDDDVILLKVEQNDLKRYCPGENIREHCALALCYLLHKILYCYSLSEKVDSIPCSFTSAFFLTRHILQNIPLKLALIIIL